MHNKKIIYKYYNYFKTNGFQKTKREKKHKYQFICENFGRSGCFLHKSLQCGKVNCCRRSYKIIFKGKIPVTAKTGQRDKFKEIVQMIEETLMKSLKDVQIKAALKSDEFKPILEEAVNDIKNESKKAKNENSVETAFETIFYGYLLKSIGLNILPEKQKPVDTIRHIRKGRMDSNVGALVFEFKHRSKLKTEKQKEKATGQILEYIDGLNSKIKSNYFGVITDGIIINFLRYEDGEIIEGDYFHELNTTDIERLIKLLITLETKSLTPDNLVQDFCDHSENSLSTRLVRILYNALNNSPTQKTNMLNAEWERLFKLGHEDKSKQKAIEDRGKVLSRIVGEKILDIPNQYKVLFCLQTSYAIIIKLISYGVISDLIYQTRLISFKSLLKNGSSESLRSFCSDFENGAIFRDIGIDNLLEGDFFSWYCSEEQWNEKIYQIISEIIEKLAIYEDKTEIFDKATINDMFRELYLNMIPNEVRYSLGEYYTPKWLAQHVLKNSLEKIDYKENWKGLDPCAGSGTFVIAMIENIINEYSQIPEISKENIFHSILNRIKAIDLNPLAVLTTRINYFIAISPFLPAKIDYIEIPVYLADSAHLPKKEFFEGIEFISYSIDTKKNPLEIFLPKSILKDPCKFSEAMYNIEELISVNNLPGAINELSMLVPAEEQSSFVNDKIVSLIETLNELEIHKWDSIWCRIIKNFLNTSSLPKFDVIIGNPPWIDWRNLPEGYREKIKSLCLKKDIFSGDRLTGGINLNICALITNVVIENWLNDSGVFAFLMPESILFQRSFEGFRNLKIENRPQLYFDEVHDWKNAGHPFYPVTEKFLTYYLSFKSPGRDYIKVKTYRKKRNKNIKDHQNSSFKDIQDHFSIDYGVAGRFSNDHTRHIYAKDTDELDNFRTIAGKCHYKARQGVEFYPQEVLVFLEDKNKNKAADDMIWVTNYQSGVSKYQIPEIHTPLEKTYLYPLLKGKDIRPFGFEYSGYIVPFPYELENPRMPIDQKTLQKNSKLLLKHFKRYEKVLSNQTEYNEKIKGKYATEFYSITRVGKYTFAPVHLIFRDNSKWCATVISKIDTEWGGNLKTLLQKHAVSICERNNNEFISEDEAHFLCAIFNAPIVEEFVLKSSDSRTFKINPLFFVPKYDPQDKTHRKLSDLSRKAHFYSEKISKIRTEINNLYLDICKKR